MFSVVRKQYTTKFNINSTYDSSICFLFYDVTFQTFGINWFTYKGISEQDTQYGQDVKHNLSDVKIELVYFFIFI